MKRVPLICFSVWTAALFSPLAVAQTSMTATAWPSTAITAPTAPAIDIYVPTINATVYDGENHSASDRIAYITIYEQSVDWSATITPNTTGYNARWTDPRGAIGGAHTYQVSVYVLHYEAYDNGWAGDYYDENNNYVPS